jgi:hypothetical protein
MREDEAEQGFVVMSVNLSNTKLTWLVVKNPDIEDFNLEEDNVIIKQADINDPKEISVVKIPIEQRFDYKLFGGFYLTTIRKNPFRRPGRGQRKIDFGKEGDAILVLADSRDPDIRKFDQTSYKLIDFETKKVTDYELPNPKEK